MGEILQKRFRFRVHFFIIIIIIIIIIDRIFENSKIFEIFDFSKISIFDFPIFLFRFFSSHFFDFRFSDFFVQIFRFPIFRFFCSNFGENQKIFFKCFCSDFFHFEIIFSILFFTTSIQNFLKIPKIILRTACDHSKDAKNRKNQGRIHYFLEFR